MEEKTLHLSLKKEWFDLIKNGVKLEEYREITQYWFKRFVDGNGNIKRFTQVHFTLGYPKKEDSDKHMTFEVEDITMNTGKEEWGAVPGKKYFVIKLGERKS